MDSERSLDALVSKEFTQGLKRHGAVATLPKSAAPTQPNEATK